MDQRGLGFPFFSLCCHYFSLKVGSVGWKRETVQVARALGETHLSGQRKQEKDPVSEKMQGQVPARRELEKGDPHILHVC